MSYITDEVKYCDNCDTYYKNKCRCSEITGVLFRSAASGLYYDAPKAAGDISAIKFGDRVFKPKAGKIKIPNTEKTTTSPPERLYDNDTKMRSPREIEFYLIKFYKRPGDGWRITFCEIQNFNTGANWFLAGIDYSHDNYGPGLKFDFFGS